MDLRKLKTLIDLVSESGISELEVNEGEDRVRIVNAGSSAPAGQVVYANPAPAQVMQTAPAASSPAPAAIAAEAPAVETGFIAKSPMVGTFYRSASPESPPFVEVGSVVKEGDTICIVEAMKILNEIEADKSGTITKIYAQNAQAVEYGSALFAIE